MKCLHIFSRLSISLVTIAVTPSWAQVARDSGAILLDQFSCSSLGTESIGAGETAGRLKSALLSIQSKEKECRGVRDAVGNLPEIDEISKMIQNSGIVSELEKAERNLSELQTDLAYIRANPQAADLYPSEALLIQYIQTAQVEVQKLRIQVGVEKKVAQRQQYISGIQQLNELSAKVINALKNNQTCMEAAPGATQGILSALVGISGFFLRPGEGLVTAIGGKILNEVFRLAEMFKSDRVKKSFEGLETAELMMGLSCTMDTLAKQQCRLIREKSLFDRVTKSCEKMGTSAEQEMCHQTRDQIRRSQTLADSARAFTNLSAWVSTVRFSDSFLSDRGVRAFDRQQTNSAADSAEMSYTDSYTQIKALRNVSPKEKTRMVAESNFSIFKEGAGVFASCFKAGSSSEESDGNSITEACTQTGSKYYDSESFGGNRCLPLTLIIPDEKVREVCDQISKEYANSTARPTDSEEVKAKRLKTPISKILKKLRDSFSNEDTLESLPTLKSLGSALADPDLYTNRIQPKINEVKSRVNEQAKTFLTENETLAKGIEFIERVGGERSSYEKVMAIRTGILGLEPKFLKKFGYNPALIKSSEGTQDPRAVPNDPLHLNGLVRSLNQVEAQAQKFVESGYKNVDAVRAMSAELDGLLGPRNQLPDNLTRIFSHYNTYSMEELRAKVPENNPQMLSILMTEMDRLRLQDALLIGRERINKDKDYLNAMTKNFETMNGFDRYFSEKYIPKVLDYLKSNSDKPLFVQQKVNFCFSLLSLPSLSPSNGSSNPIIEACEKTMINTPYAKDQKLEFKKLASRSFEQRVCVNEDVLRAESYESRYRESFAK